MLSYFNYRFIYKKWIDFHKLYLVLELLTKYCCNLRYTYKVIRPTKMMIKSTYAVIVFFLQKLWLYQFILTSIMQCFLIQSIDHLPIDFPDKPFPWQFPCRFGRSYPLQGRFIAVYIQRYWQTRHAQQGIALSLAKSYMLLSWQCGRWKL